MDNAQRPQKRYRADSHGQDSSQSHSKSSKRACHAASSPAPSHPQKPPKDFHLRRKDVPEKAKKVQDALHLHLHILWCSFSQDTVPPLVDGGLIDTFNERFKEAGPDGVYAHVESLVDNAEPISHNVLKYVEDVKRNAHLGTAMIAKNAVRVEDSFLQYMFTAVARAGLQRWAPDVLGSSDSLYNLLHEHLAISTFKHVLSSWGYVFLGADTTYAQNNILLTKFYKSFIFSYMAKKARSETKKPGALQSTVEHNNAFRRRKHLSNTRTEQLKAQGYRAEVIHLAQEPDAHSDDELDPTAEASVVRYRIKEKCGRSQTVKGLFHFEDGIYRDRMRCQRRSGQRVDRVRVEPNPPIEEQSHSPHPLNVPIDYFSPDYYNNHLTLRE